MISNADRMQDYTQDYQLAEAAYLQGNYEKAAAIIDTLVTRFHDDPSVRLLRGHIYCYGLYQYEIGKKEYEYVLSIATDPEFIQFATSGLEYASSCLSQTSESSAQERFNGGDSGGHYRDTSADSAELLTWRQPEDLTADEDFDLAALNFNVDMSGQLFPPQGTDFFAVETNAPSQKPPPVATGFYNNEQETLTDAFAFGYDRTENPSSQLFEDLPLATTSEASDDTGFFNISPAAHRAFATFDPDLAQEKNPAPAPQEPLAVSERPTLVVPVNGAASHPVPEQVEFSVEDISDALNEISGALPMAWPPTAQSSETPNWMSANSMPDNLDDRPQVQNNGAAPDGFDLAVAQVFQDTFQPSANDLATNSPKPQFTGIDRQLASTNDDGPQSGFFDLPDNFLEQPVPSAIVLPKSSGMFDDSSTFINGVSISGIKNQPGGSISNIYREDSPNMTNLTPQGMFAPFENASFQKKQWLISVGAGLGTIVAIASVTFANNKRHDGGWNRL